MKKSNSDFLTECFAVLAGVIVGFLLTFLACSTYKGTKIAYEDKYGNLQVVKVRSYIEDTNNNTITFKDMDNEVYNNIDNYVIIN